MMSWRRSGKMISLSLLTTTHKAHWVAHPSWNAYTTCERQDATQATIVNGVCPALCFSTSLGLSFFNFESIETTCSTLKLWDTLLFLSAFKMHPPPCDLVFVKLKIFGWGAFLLHLLHLVTVTFAKKSLLGKQNYLTKISRAQTIAKVFT